MSEQSKFPSFIESRIPMNWNMEDLWAAEQEMVDDDQSVLSDVPSLASSMDIDMGPFGSDPVFASGPDPGRFSLQYLLPLEVQHP